MNARWILRAAVAAAVVASAASLCVTARKGVESDLFALVGSGGEALRGAAAASANVGHFLVRAESREAAARRLAELGVEGASADGEGASGGVAKALKALAPYAHGFLSAETRRRLEGGDYASVRDAAAARLFSPVPSVLPPSEDPFLLFTDYVLERGAPNGGWVAVSVEIAPDEALAALGKVKGADDVRCAGAPFHTAVASANSRREINVLSVVSLACVILFGWMLTGGLRFLPLLAASLAAAFCVATAALFACFPKPHLMTFVFGTTLIGLSVDYVYHALAAKGPIARPLTFSFVSTAACFLPLMLSEVGVLRQMALFTVTGLATVYAGVLAWGGRGAAGGGADSPQPHKPSTWRFRLAATAAAMLGPIGLALAGMWLGVIGGSQTVDVSRFYRPDAYLAEGERIALEANGGSGFIPGADEQRRNLLLVRRLYEAEGANYRRMTGLPENVFALPDEGAVFDPKGAIEGLFDGWWRETGRLLLVSLAVLFAVLAAMFGRGCARFVLPVMMAFVATDGFLMCMGEWRNFFARICFFIFIGLGLDYCIFRWHAERSGWRGTGKAMWYSFLTSFAGFGLLGFTDFAVTRLMGLTLAFGLGVSYFAAKVWGGIWERVAGDGACGEVGARWYEQDEQCASRFWVEFMWWSYAIFGKTFQKLIFVIGMPFIYVFARPARLALAKYYAVLSERSGGVARASHMTLFRHLLGFAWGLMDKTDACTLKKNLPAMGVRDDAGWRSFSGLVESGKGAFILCTHVGVIGVLPALPHSLRARGAARAPKVHAFQQMGHDAVFMRAFMRHFDHSALVMHAVEEIGVETAVSMQEAIARGELVIMAGDRTSAGSGSVLRHAFLGRECVWPKGAFRFAELMEAPVFAVTCVNAGWNRYEVHVAELERGALLDGFVRFLEAETLAHPDQWYHFYDFFGAGS